jgi:3',5'-cyclic AMP phosphodiesterase CpdA
LLPSEGHRASGRSAKPIIDPRLGDVEDDGSSTKSRSMMALAGSLLAEISLPKLAVSWTLLIGFPALVLGASPLLASMWIGSVSSKLYAVLTGIGPALALAALAAAGWYGVRPLSRLLETSFWSLNALAIQPAYALCRESLRHLVEGALSAGMSQERRASVRAALAAAAGLAVCLIGLLIIALLWPATHWVGEPADLASPGRIALAAAANAIVIVAGYLAAAGLFWGVADATMPQPLDLRSFHPPPQSGRRWRIAHLSDIHAVGERYGFRIESGRMGPCGNARFDDVLTRLEEIHRDRPLDVILVTGDLTDAGRSGEWAEFFDALARHPQLMELMVAIPGNHDVNVVDRANPARLDLPFSPTKRLRQLRTISALEKLQGAKVKVVDHETGQLGSLLADALRPRLADIRAFADDGSRRLSRSLAELWNAIFPMVLPPATDEGLGIILLNTNAETHFSFTNALGVISREQERAIDIAVDRYPDACWIVALHHHPVEYPMAVKALSERVGTALVNGSWFVRRLQRLANRAVVMHGHRHVDWIGKCGGLLIVSGPSPVMEAKDTGDTYFYIHNLVVGEDRSLQLLEPERVEIGGRKEA